MLKTPHIVTVCLNPAIDRVIEVPGLALGAHQVGKQLRRTPGGKAVNVARVLASLGVPCVITGFLGDETRGEFKPLLENPLIADEFFAVFGRTRENVTLADPRSGQETHIRDRGTEVSPADVDRLSRKLERLAKPGSYVIFSGSLPPGVETGNFAAMVGTCIKGEAKVAVDTGGATLRSIADKLLWLLKPNAEELAEFVQEELPTPDTQLSAARALTSRVENVILTRGAEGAYLFSTGAALHASVEVPDGFVRNTVGCGDALMGAFVAGVSRGDDLSKTFADAVACATATAASLTPEFDPEIYNQLRAKVAVEDV